MDGFAAVVLAHTDAPHVRRLIDALDDVPVVLHCDAKTPAPVFEQMTRALPARVALAPRLSASLASWSLVAAELSGLRTALATTSAAHIAVLSGADYPLLSMPDIERELASWDGASWYCNSVMPHEPWSTPRHPDGGLWRVRHRYLTRDGHIRFVRGVPLRLPWRRAVPDGLELRAASQWKVFARADVETLLRVVDTRPDLIDFWRTTLVPDESFAASILASPRITGEPARPTCVVHPWFQSWDVSLSDHPSWLTADDLTALRATYRRPSLSRAEALVATDLRMPHRKLFARKFQTGQSDTVLDALDTDRMQQPAGS